MPRKEPERFVGLGDIDKPAESILRYGAELYSLTDPTVPPEQAVANKSKLDKIILDFLLYRAHYRRAKIDPFPTKRRIGGAQEIVYTDVALYRGEDREYIHPESRNIVIVKLLVPGVGTSGGADTRDFQTDLHRLAIARAVRETENVSGSGFMGSDIVYKETFGKRGGQEDTQGRELPGAYLFRSIDELIALRIGAADPAERKRALGHVLNRVADLSARVPGDVTFTPNHNDRMKYNVTAYQKTVEINLNELSPADKNRFLQAIGQGGTRRNP